MTTPQTEEKALAQELGVPALFLKREDLHPYGSHKGRSIPVMIDMKASRGAKGFAISSSGNAALAAIRHTRAKNAAGANLSLLVLVGKRINAEKKARLIAEATGDALIEIAEAERPLQRLLDAVRGGGRESLRQSNDDEALVGYRTLAEELALIPALSAVFMPTSSGTAAQALAEYFDEKKLPIAVHIVQTDACHPLAIALGAKSAAEEHKKGVGLCETSKRSLADAIVDKIAYRREALSKAIQTGKGAGWIVDNADIARAQKLLASAARIEATGNGALGIAGLAKALESGQTFSGAVACIITGK